MNSDEGLWKKNKDLDVMEIRRPFDSTHVLGVLLVQW